MIYGEKKITTLAEDFSSLGLINEKKSEGQKNSKKLQESNDSNNAAKVKAKKIAETKKRRVMAKRKKLAESRKLKSAKVEALRKSKIKKLRESQKSKKNKAVASENTSDVIKNLMNIESKLKSTASNEDIFKAFENVSKVGKLAISKFDRIAEDLTDNGRDAADNDGSKQSSANKEIGKDTLDVNDKEGNVGYDKDDEQEGSVKNTGSVDTVTGKYAGKPAHKDPKAQDVKIAEEDEGEKDDDDEEKDEAFVSDDEMELDGEDDTEFDDAGGEESDAEMDMDIDLDDMDDISGAEAGAEFGDDEGGDAADIDPESGDDDNLDMGGSADAGDMDMGDELGDDDLSGDDLDAIELDLDADDKGEDEDDLGMGEMDDEEYSDDEEREESLSPKKSDYVSELRGIVKEAEDTMAKIKTHAVTPQAAESLLKDVVMRLGGAVGDLGDMNKYAATDKTTTA